MALSASSRTTVKSPSPPDGVGNMERGEREVAGGRGSGGAMLVLVEALRGNYKGILIGKRGNVLVGSG